MPHPLFKEPMPSRGSRPFVCRGQQNRLIPMWAVHNALDWFRSCHPDGDFPPIDGPHPRAVSEAVNLQRTLRNLNATGFAIYG